MIAAIQSAIFAVNNLGFIAHAFYKAGPDEAPWVTGFPGDPGAVDHTMWGGRSAIPLPHFIRDSNNNYIAVSAFKRASDGRYRRRKDCFAGMYIVMIDDVGTKVAFDKLVLPPTCLVETSPGNFQAWYFLKAPERDRIRAETLVKGMIASGLTADGADPGMSGVTRYGRLPVGVNGKSKYVECLGHPFVQRVTAWSPEQRYSIDEIADAYGVNLQVTCAPRRKAPPRTRQIPDLGTPDGHDGITSILDAAGLYLEPLSGLQGGHRIVCPWVHEHTDEDQTGTVYFEPSDQNDGRGGFKCHHGHCQQRTVADLTHFLIRLLQNKNEESPCNN